MNEIGDLIKNRREELKLTQQDVGDFVGVSKATVQKWECGKIKDVRRDKIAALARILQINPLILIDKKYVDKPKDANVQIPVLGFVRAGYPMYAEENIIDYEEISAETARSGEFFALKVRGDSMEPGICEDDTVIVRKQPIVENGETAVVLVNGNEATVKRFFKTEAGVKLISTNPQYDPFFFTPKEVNDLPVEVVGRVVELRRKF